MQGQAKLSAAARFFAVFVCVSAALAVFVLPAHAQISGLGFSLVATPKSPAPYDSVTVSLNDYSVDSLGADVRWYYNDVELADRKNERTITVQVGALGSKAVVRATLVRSSAPTLSASVTLVPAAIDIVLESRSYVPLFYRGRALPSPSSQVRAVAIVNTGSDTSSASYTYTWSEGGSVLFGGPLKGKSVVELTMPRYGGGPLSVEVHDGNGTLVGESSVPLVANEPELRFYEESPLRGLSERELLSPYVLVGNEVTVYGEPYYLDAGVSAAETDFSWTIDGRKVSSDPDAQNGISLQKTGGAGGASIDLTVVTKARVPQYLKRAFELVFN